VFPVNPLSSTAAAAAAGRGRLGGRVEVMGHRNGMELRHALEAAKLGDVALWAGRRALHYGPAHGGGLVIGGDALVTGLGAVVTDRIRLPWILGLLRPMGMEGFFSRARGGELIVDPWFWRRAAHGVAAPAVLDRREPRHMFGGNGTTPVTREYALQIFVGMRCGIEGEFDSHFGSVDG
jgi:hypothetical protein